MTTFYLEAIPMMNGQLVELRAFIGSQHQHGHSIGSWTFERAEWELFRVLLIAGINNSHIPTQLLDQTRRRGTPPPIGE